ncbi:MAG: ATP-dependent RecD-like DNA helicase, partial [Acidobacteriota bacterium]
MTIESRPRAGASAGDAGTDRDADTLEGVVTRVTFQNPDSAWAVVRLDVARPAARRGSATAVGVMPGVEAGLRARLTGAWTRDPKHGEQFRAEGFLPLRPETRDGIVRYLAAGALPGVGPATAKRLVKHFGTEVLGVLDHQPERLEEISGIGGKKMAAIRDAWRSQHADRSALIFLHGHGVTPALAARIVKTYGGDAMRRVRARPYDLVQDIHGVGFLTADRIAQAVGIAPHAPERAAAG